MSIEIRQELKTANVQAWKSRVVERNLRDRKQGLSRSLYYSLGTELIEDGVRGITTLSKWLWKIDEKRDLYIGSSLYKDLQDSFPKRLQKFKDDYSKIWAGIALDSSEEILCGNEDRVSGMKICAWHNAATKYTHILKLLPLKGIYPYIMPSEREELLRVNNEDETNVSLTGQHINRLPNLLQEYLEYAQVVPNITSRINPFVSQIASELVPLQHHRNKTILDKIA